MLIQFQKALTIFEEITTQQPTNYFFFQKTIECFQQLQQYEKAEIIGIKNLSGKYLYSTEKHGTIDCKTFWFKESSVFFLSISNGDLKCSKKIIYNINYLPL